MDIKELTANYQTIVSIVIFAVSLVGFYWKLKMDFATGIANLALEIAKINKSIKDIEIDRVERWDAQTVKCNERKTDFSKMEKLQKEKDDKMEAYLADIMKLVNNMDKKTERIANDVDWLKRNK